MNATLPFSGTVWRAVFAGADPVAVAQAPEGRFHHSGQVAVYCSLTAAGCAVAIARYVRADDPLRVVVPLQVETGRLADLRGRAEVSAVWQDVRAAGALSPTWVFSDAARDAGAQGMLYSSRSYPDLTHLVLFDPGVIRAVGAALPFPG